MGQHPLKNKWENWPINKWVSILKKQMGQHLLKKIGQECQYKKTNGSGMLIYDDLTNIM
jgi:hypothetical protein